MQRTLQNSLMALLAVNVFLYAVVDGISALEELAWLGLLLLIDAEVHFQSTVARRRILHAVRLLLGLLILGTFVCNVLRSDWLDIINTVLWFAIVIGMELEIRFPGRSGKGSLLQTVHHGVLLPGLVLVAGLWSWQGAWLDAYDAVLWLAAYVILERDLGVARASTEKTGHTLKNIPSHDHIQIPER